MSEHHDIRVQTPALQLSGVCFGYPDLPVLEDVDMTVHPGEFLGVIGPNGGGKSTLLKLILGLLPPQQGTVRVLGQTPVAARPRVGYCPQHALFRRDFPMLVEDVVYLGRLGLPGTRWGYGPRDHEQVQAALHMAEVQDLARRPLSALSGGQLQRVLIARALASEPELLLLDEPSAHLDERIEVDLYDLLARLQGRMTIIVVSHDLGFISDRVQRVACVNRRVYCHHPQEIDSSVMDQLYHRHVRAIAHDHADHHDHATPPNPPVLS